MMMMTILTDKLMESKKLSLSSLLQQSPYGGLENLSANKNMFLFKMLKLKTGAELWGAGGLHLHLIFQY